MCVFPFWGVAAHWPHLDWLLQGLDATAMTAKLRQMMTSATKVEKLACRQLAADDAKRYKQEMVRLLSGFMSSARGGASWPEQEMVLLTSIER